VTTATAKAFPARLRGARPGDTAENVIAEARRIRREQPTTEEDEQFVAWVRGYRPSTSLCPRCGKRCYRSHVLAARHAAYLILERPSKGGTCYKVYLCHLGGNALHIGR
jgi:hypothetical protein